MLTEELCPACEEGLLRSSHHLSSFPDAEGEVHAERHFHVCDTCGAAITTAADAKANARAIRAARKVRDGLLTGSAIASLRAKLGVNQAVAGAIFGGGPVAFCKYENEEVTQSAAMDNLLWLVNEYPQLCSFLARRHGCDLPNSCEYRTSSSPIFISHVSSDLFSEVLRDILQSPVIAPKRPWAIGIYRKPSPSANEEHVFEWSENDVRPEVAA